MSGDKKNIIIYNTADGKASVSLYAKDGMVWMNQNQIAELFATSKQNIGQHIANILKEEELSENSVVKNYLTTAADGKQYKVTYYALDIFPPDFGFVDVHKIHLYTLSSFQGKLQLDGAFFH